MKRIILILAITLSLCGFACNVAEEDVALMEQHEIREEQLQIRKEQTRQAAILKSQKNDLEKSSVRMDSLEALIRVNSAQLESTRTFIMGVVGNNKDRFESEIDQSRNELTQRTKTGLFLLVSALVIMVLALMLLKRKMTKQGMKLYSSISESKMAHDEEAIKLDNQLIDLASKQLDLLQKYQPETKGNTELDHSLVLKIANEITRIQQNLNHMDHSIRGHKQLSRATSAILDNLNANAYEIPQLIGMPFDDNDNMIATMELDESIDPGQRIIKRVVKPMVKYNGTMIQAAEIFVAFNHQE
ncbi:MAG: hypothetical protein PHY48_11365 [Candidatus Cloacimonetes bacterium]|nr:hypothetical protein [Candidatus Cloacimonadota bacterium]